MRQGLAIAVLAIAWAGCQCGGPDLGRARFACTTDVDCGTGYTCLDGECSAGENAGGGGGSSGGDDGGPPDSGDNGDGGLGADGGGGGPGADGGADGGPGADAGSDGGSGADGGGGDDGGTGADGGSDGGSGADGGGDGGAGFDAGSDGGADDGGGGDGGSGADGGGGSDGGAPDACVPETNTEMCTRLGKNCAVLSGQDNCGSARSPVCGACTAPAYCAGGGTANVCGGNCTTETDAQLCTRLGRDCGSPVLADQCGTPRVPTSCGTCTGPAYCGGGGTANVCGGNCTETDAQLCVRLGKTCGTPSLTDLCGVIRTPNCGSCTAPAYCGGSGTANACGGTCTTETDPALCARFSKTCGAPVLTDLCGNPRTPATCGTCSSPAYCGGGGTANACGGDCTSETDTALCTRFTKNCGKPALTDLCGNARTPGTCGACTPTAFCGGGGTPNVCGGNCDFYLDARYPSGTGFYGAGCPAGSNSWVDLVGGQLGTLTNFSVCGANSGWLGTGVPTDPYRLILDGSNDRIVVPDDLVFGFVPQTVEVWFRTSVGGVLLGIQDVAYPGTPTNWAPVLLVGASGVLHGGYYTGSTAQISTPAAVNDGMWHHAVLTISGAAPNTTERLYLDDTLVGSLTGLTVAFETDHKQTVGAGYSSAWTDGNGGNYPFKGEIGVFAFYKRRLLQAEVTSNCNALKGNFSGAVCN